MTVDEQWRIATVLLGGLATLSIYSFLVKENPIYRFVEHVFIGISTGMGLVFGVRDFLWPKVFEPLLGLNRVVYPDGTFSEPYNSWNLLFLLPMAFGMLYYFIFSKKFSWLAKLVIGFSLGMSGGAAFKGTLNEILPQIFDSFRPLLVFSPEGALLSWQSFENSLFVFTLLSVMLYFFFSYRFTAESRPGKFMSYSGRWLLMVCFGAFFGSTVMARMALLVERMQFLLEDFWEALKIFV